MKELKKSMLQEGGRCLICERRCIIKEGGKGHCRTRIKSGGVINTLNYGNISSISINPIEKKPLFHFYPGSRALTVGHWSCNFDCPWCQNHDITKVEPEFNEYLSPADFVRIGLVNSCDGTSISFNEPTLFLEWGIEVFKIAKEKKLYNTIVTNGYMTEKALCLFLEAGLDAANVDIKGSRDVVRRYCHVDVAKVWRNCKTLKKENIHLEITTLVIPEVNDDLKQLLKIGEKILSELGNIPWHLTRYFPAYKFSAPPTPIKFLENAHQAIKQLGFDFVYLGNVVGHEYENTYCPECGELLIKRAGLEVIEKTIDSKLHCPECNKNLEAFFVS